MQDNQIERELADGEPWCLWQRSRPVPHCQQNLEPEQETVDIYEEALQHYLEQTRSSSSNGLGSRKEGSLSQLISYCFGLLKLRNFARY